MDVPESGPNPGSGVAVLVYEDVCDTVIHTQQIPEQLDAESLRQRPVVQKSVLDDIRCFVVIPEEPNPQNEWITNQHERADRRGLRNPTDQVFVKGED